MHARKIEFNIRLSYVVLFKNKKFMCMSIMLCKLMPLCCNPCRVIFAPCNQQALSIWKQRSLCLFLISRTAAACAPSRRPGCRRPWVLRSSSTATTSAVPSTRLGRNPFGKLFQVSLRRFYKRRVGLGDFGKALRFRCLTVVQYEKRLSSNWSCQAKTSGVWRA